MVEKSFEIPFVCEKWEDFVFEEWEDCANKKSFNPSMSQRCQLQGHQTLPVFVFVFVLDMVANVVKLDQIPHLSPRPSSSSSINLLILLPTMQFLQISFLFVVTFLACLQLISNNEEQTCLLLNQSLELDELEELEQHLGKIIVTSKILQATIFNCGAQVNHFQLQLTKIAKLL